MTVAGFVHDIKKHFINRQASAEEIAAFSSFINYVETFYSASTILSRNEENQFESEIAECRNLLIKNDFEQNQAELGMIISRWESCPPAWFRFIRTEVFRMTIAGQEKCPISIALLRVLELLTSSRIDICSAVPDKITHKGYLLFFDNNKEKVERLYDQYKQKKGKKCDAIFLDRTKSINIADLLKKQCPLMVFIC